MLVFAYNTMYFIRIIISILILTISFSENRCLKWKDTALYLINSIDDSSIYIPQLSNSACDIVIVNSTLLPSKKKTLYHYISLDFVVESIVCS